MLLQAEIFRVHVQSCYDRLIVKAMNTTFFGAAFWQFFSNVIKEYMLFRQKLESS